MPQQSRTEKYAQELSRLIRLETVSHEGQENDPKFAAFRQTLKEMFPLLFRTCEYEDFSGGFLLRWPGEDPQRKPFLLMNHHDVVEPGGNWTHPPFSGDIADGKLWGRGTADDKGALWAMLRGAEELVEQGFRPRRDIYFESSCTEETDGIGAQRIAQALKERGIQFELILDEGGAVVYDPIGGADGTFAMVGMGEKGCADLRFVAHSQGGHASTPPKNSSLVRLGKFMAATENASLFPARLNEVTMEMLRRIAPFTKPPMRWVFRHPRNFRFLLTRVVSSFSPAFNAIVRTTIAFTMSEASSQSNVLPQDAWVVGNMRFSHHQGGMASREAIRKFAAKYDLKMDVLDPGIDSPISDYRSESFQRIETAVSAFFPGVVTSPYIQNGASDSRYFAKLGPCFRFIPFLLSDQQLAAIHGPDENVDLAALEPAVKFYKHIISRA